MCCFALHCQGVYVLFSSPAHTLPCTFLGKWAVGKLAGLEMQIRVRSPANRQS